MLNKPSLQTVLACMKTDPAKLKKIRLNQPRESYEETMGRTRKNLRSLGRLGISAKLRLSKNGPLKQAA